MISPFSKKKPNVYLGELYVAPRRGIKKLDEWGLLKSARLQKNIQLELNQMIGLAKLCDIKDLKNSDIAIDFAVPSYQGGALGSVLLNTFAFLIFWRPKVKISARVYNASTGKTKFTVHYTAKMPWSTFLSRQISLRNLLGLKPSYDIDDLIPLMYQACIKVLIETKFKLKLLEPIA